MTESSKYWPVVGSGASWVAFNCIAYMHGYFSGTGLRLSVSFLNISFCDLAAWVLCLATFSFYCDCFFLSVFVQMYFTCNRMRCIIGLTVSTGKGTFEFNPILDGGGGQICPPQLVF